jgi:hypothetical protein
MDRHRAGLAEVVKLSLADALFVIANMRDEDRLCASAVLGVTTDDVYAVNRWQTEGPAWTLLQDGEPAAIFGLSMHVPWAATAWLIATPRFHSWRKLLRHCRTVLGNMAASPLHRIECQVVTGWPEAEAFARRAGFDFEGVRVRAGRNRQDILLFAITRA